MTKLLFTVALVCFFAAGNYAFAQELEKIRIVYASRSIPFLSSFVAKEKGFYRKHGLDVELIQIAPRLAVTALATNEVDYSMNIGSSLRAAMRGLPLRAVASSTVASFFALVAREKSVQGLKGKLVGVALDRFAPTVRSVLPLVDSSRISQRNFLTSLEKVLGRAVDAEKS